MSKSIILFAGLDGLDDRAERLLRLCSEGRREKIERCKSAQARRQSLGAELCFLAAAKRAGIPEEYFRLPDGKPQPRAEGWYMSLTHAEDLAGCALATTSIGLDAEPEARSVKESMARRILAPGETGDLLLTWVKKESYLKRTGEGIRRNMSDFSIAETPGGTIVLRRGGYCIGISTQMPTEQEVIFYTAEELQRIVLMPPAAQNLFIKRF